MDRLWIVAIGGLIPAFAFGIAAIFQKAALINGVGVGTYVFYVGLSMSIAGIIGRMVFGETGWGAQGMGFAFLAGIGMIIGIGFVSFAVQRMGAPISLLVPIHAIAPLVTVVVGFLVFKEYENVAAIRLISGALFLLVGAILVATS